MRPNSAAHFFDSRPLQCRARFGHKKAGHVGLLQRQQLYLTRPVWEPVFEPDAATLSGIGDAVGKINAVIPGYFGKENLRDLTGIRTEN